MRDLETLSAYRVLTRRTVSELNSEGYVLEHKKSGARLFLLSNEDDNKVFSIGFRSPAHNASLPAGRSFLLYKYSDAALHPYKRPLGCGNSR